jgi:KAP family P-loop domain
MEEAIKKHSLNDDPVLTNAFNSDFINRLCPIIQDCNPPKSIAITGYWGSGKTSTLKQLYYHLSGELPPGCNKDVGADLEALYNDEMLVPVWFEAWRYQHESQPIVALLNEIRVKMGLLNKFIHESEKLGSVSLLSSLTIFDEIIKMASGGSVTTKTGKIMETGEKWENERYLNKLPGQKIREFMEQAIGEALGEKNGCPKRLIIFIDDLDRCLPKASLRLLEGIKIYLNLSNCIIVLGMDHRQLEQSLLEALPWIDIQKEDDSQRASYYAHEYLEKICQDIHYLPIPSKEEKAEYFLGLLNSICIGDEDVTKNHLEFIGKLLSQYDCLPANPRKIKTLVNRTALTLRAVQPKIDEGGDKAVGKREYAIMLVTVLIYTFHKQVYEQLDGSPKYISEVINYSKSAPDLHSDDRYQPMKDVLHATDKEGMRLPLNPSDSNVFRLHELINDFDVIEENEITPYLRLKR